MNKKLISLSLLLLTSFCAMADDFTIANEADWETFAGSDSYATGTITLTADITAAKGFAADFSGTFDGQGHTITLEPAAKTNFSLFQSTVAGAVIKNLNLTGDVSSISKISGFIGTVKGETTIENVHSTVNINSSGYPVAGFVLSCTAKTNFINCSYKGNITCTQNASDEVSCFISTTSGNGAFKFQNCSTAGTITVLNGWRCANYVSTDNVDVGDAIFENCIMACDMMQENGSERMGGFVGSPKATRMYTFTGCLAMGKVKRFTSNSDHTIISSTNCLVLGCNQWSAWKYTTKNSYYTSSADYENSDTRGFLFATDEQLASGALCYNLNGDQSSIAYYQTLGEDALPVLDATHKQVYASGRKHCDGTDYEGVTYNNVSGETTKDEHDFQNGLCSYCSEPAFDDEGYFHINSDKAWEVFAKMISTGKTDVNVKLDNDLSITSMLSSGYRGTFDGQGHTITLDLGAESGKYSIFNTIGAATIRNVIFEGRVTGESCSSPVCCYASGNLTLENILSKVTVTQTTLNDGNCGGIIGCANANITFRNCIFAGHVNAMKDAGGFAGWGASRTFTLENCAMIGDVTVSQGSSSVFLRVQNNSCTYNVTNCYYVQCTPKIVFGNGSEMCTKAELIDQDAIASGALCYKLNGDQSQINFYQKIGEDQMPSVDPSRGQVYSSGRRHCDGTDYTDINYNNTSGETTQDKHEYENNYCTYCGALQLDESGVFHIVDEAGYAAFAQGVAKDATISAVLEADLSLDACPQIGGSGNSYAGTFDGQGHTLNVNVNSEGIGGLFYSTKGATIKNLVINGSIKGTQAAIVGDCLGELHMENIIMNASVTGTLNVGGLIGTSSASATYPATFKNILVTSIVTYIGTSGKNGAGGFAGWAGYGDFEAENCAFIGDIAGDCQTSAYMFRTKASPYTTYKITNCAYIPVEGVTYCNGNGSERAAGTAFESAADGELCYFLNGHSWKSPVFYQQIGVDDAPTFEAAQGVVYPMSDTYVSTDVTTEEGVRKMVENLIADAEEITNVENRPAQKSIAEAYTAAFESLQEISTFAELVAAYYPAIDEIRAKLESSAKAYQAYIQKVEDTKKYLDEHAEDFKKGAMFSKLEVYLEGEIIEPSEDEYPNGSSGYILDSENLLLDNAQLEAEKAFIDKMLEDALNEGLNPGADITTMLVNADFSDGFNAWEGTKMTTAAINEDGNMRVAESWSAKPFDMYQTITVPENGVYELQINGAYRLADLGDSQQHGAFVYMNGNKNYLQADIEDMISIDDAVHRLNCWIEGSTPDFLVEDKGYTAHGQQGAAYAFLAGRYPNRILCNVTDGKLTVGIKNSHVLTSGNEWVAVGNLKLTYCGTLDQAGDAIDATLASMKARADFILNDYQYASDLNYKYYPNYSSALKAELKEKVDAIATTTEVSDKYALIGEIGDIFQRILDCKVKYIRMFTMMEALASMVDSMEDSEKANAVGNACIATGEGYESGRYTTEEAAVGGDLKDCGMWPNFDENGTLLISTADELDMFAALVNQGGMTSQNATFTADVVANSTFPMIAGTVGETEISYVGTIDGQGHTVTLDINAPDQSSVGFIRKAGAATVKNIKFDGTINGGQNTGLVAIISGNFTFNSVNSALVIEGGNNTGGFAGNAGGGTQYITDCVFSGKVTTTVNGVGGFYGWSASNKVVANNLLSVGEVVGEQAAYIFRVKCDGTVGTAGDAGCRVSGGNMYYKRTSDPSVLVSGTPLWWGEFLTDVILEVDENQLTSGEVCYKLNNGNTENPMWRQTLGTDKTPQLNSDSKIVYEKEGVYYNEDSDSKMGDLNGDGSVDGSDIVTLVNIVNAGGGNVIYDLNSDGAIDGTDIVLLVNLVNNVSNADVKAAIKAWNIRYNK